MSRGNEVIAPHCQQKCGNIDIPWPFGIGDGCFFEEHNNTTFSSFEIHCQQNSTTPPTPIFGTNLEIENISILEGELRINLVNVSYKCYNQTGYEIDNRWQSLNLKSFTISSAKNNLIAIGCDTYAWFTGYRHNKRYHTGCMTQCVELNDAIDGECSGIGCCQSPLPTGVKNVTIEARSFSNHISVYSFNPCSVAFPMAKDAFTFYKSNLTQNFSADHRKMLPVVLNWSIGLKNCSKAKEDGNFLCKQNAECVDVEYQLGYHCQCKHGYGGNPYMPRGCIDIDECKQENDCEKAAYCYNTVGSYYCKCPKGYHGDGTTSSHCISNRKSWLVPVLVTAGIGGGIITLLVIGFILYWKHGEHKVKKMRESFFRENGGFLLHEILTGRNIKTLSIFTMQDLETATNNYSEKNIIGRGGFGIVHKGILPNGQLVAIKRSLKVDPNQVEQFINEILVLSQINNKNVVMLLGCCLESEVPLLVYEFVNNGTLYEHLHDSVKASILKWPLRLRIASEIADVLSYLHNTISTPIIHRDVKSLNVLLDACYTAKVIDFGASKLILSDQNQFATMVIGTRGYLDPEYMQTSELTSKSDVYSFGVVLVELLTRLNAFSNSRQESEKCLAMHFLLKMKDGRVMEIIDRNILNEGTNEQIQQVANLAKWCLMLKGEDRPTMKEVFIELETIKERGSHPWRENNKYTEEDCQTLLGETSTSCEGGYSSFCIDSDLYEPLSSLGKGR
ncbi:unnamed protein product [Amaranthus hypochondriacus]